MIESLRKGWCPGALRPMMAKDGLLVRLRITGGVLPAAAAHALADLALAYGNGLFDLSARGNLQMRGVGDDALGPLQDGLAALGLLDPTEGAESVRNVIASPLAGLHGGLNIRPIVAALEERLTRDTRLHALPGKFGFLVDDGSWPSLAGIAADVRFDWIEETDRFSIGLGGSRDSALRIGLCEASNLVDNAEHIARSTLSLLDKWPESRRMRDLIGTLGSDLVARACSGIGDDTVCRVPATRAPDVVGRQTFHQAELASRMHYDPVALMVRRPKAVSNHEGGPRMVPPGVPRGSRRSFGPPHHEGIKCLGLAAPFGRLDSTMLHTAAVAAETTSLGELRLTPWRTILIPGAVHDIIHLDSFITDPTDPRLAVTACVGADGCARGTTSTHADAAHLATRGIDLHISGCAKGCAKPSPSRVTLVARDGRYDLVRDGRASDPPTYRGLDLATARAILETA